MMNLAVLNASGPTSSHPDAALVKALEELLEKARSGEVQAVAYACVTADRGVGTEWHGAEYTALQMTAAISMLSMRYIKGMVEGDDA